MEEVCSWSQDVYALYKDSRVLYPTSIQLTLILKAECYVNLELHCVTGATSQGVCRPCRQ